MKHRELIIIAIVLVLAFMMAGCETLRGTTNINVPVPVECQEKMPDEPVLPVDSLKPGGSLFDANIAKEATIELLEGYAGTLRTALAACIKPISPEGTPAPGKF